MVIAWRLTGTPGAFKRATIWILIATVSIVSIYDWVYLALQAESLRSLWSILGLIILIPLAHLIIVDRAWALRDANDIDWLLEDALPGPVVVAQDSYVAPGWDPLNDQPVGTTSDPVHRHDPETPLACEAGKESLISRSIELEEEYADHDSSFSDLHFAAAMEYPEQAQFLLSRGAEPDQRDSRGITPIQIAALNGRLENVELLIGAGANQAQLDLAGRSLLDIAMIQDHQHLVNWLQGRAAKD